MFYYMIYGLVVQTDYLLEEAYAIAKPDKVDVVICEGNLDKELVTETEDEVLEGQGWIFYYTQKWAGARYIHQGAFRMEGGNTIQYHLKPECDKLFVNQIILCFCLSIILIQRGKVALHGSGIIVNGKVMVISGESGSGKSTITTALLSSGLEYIADDTVAIDFTEEAVIAYSGYPQRKLCMDTMLNFNLNPEDFRTLPDYEKEKYAIKQLDNYHPEAVELGGLVILTPSEDQEVKLIPITGSEKLKYVKDNLYNKTIYNYLGFGKREFEQCMKIANQVQVFILKRPMNQMTVVEQMKALEAIVW